MKKPASKPFLDFTGKVFGKLTCAWPAGKNKFNKIYWLTFCECGNSFVTKSNNLRTGKVKHCGCSPARLKHGHAYDGRKSSEYSSWQAMLARCLNKNSTGYERYGGRGISVCKSWQENFSNFLSDMGPKPSSSHTIERIDTNGNYEPSNCRWATRTEQANNTRSNTFLRYLGKTKTVSEWARELGISRDLIYKRLKKKWSIAKVLQVTNLKQNRRVI